MRHVPLTEMLLDRHEASDTALGPYESEISGPSGAFEEADEKAETVHLDTDEMGFVR